MKKLIFLELSLILIIDQIASQRNSNQNRQGANNSPDSNFSTNKTSKSNKSDIAAQILSSEDIQPVSGPTTQGRTIGLGPVLVIAEMTEEIRKGNFAKALAVGNDFINSRTNIFSTLSDDNFGEYLLNDKIKLEWLETWKSTAKVNDMLILMGDCASKLKKNRIALVYYYFSDDNDKVLAILQLFHKREAIKKEEAKYLFRFAVKNKNYEPASKLFCNTGKCFYIDGDLLFVRIFFCKSFSIYYLFAIFGVVVLIFGYFYLKRRIPPNRVTGANG